MLFTRGRCHGYTGVQPLEPLRGSTSGLMPPPPLVIVLSSSMLSSNSTFEKAHGHCLRLRKPKHRRLLGHQWPIREQQEAAYLSPAAHAGRRGARVGADLQIRGVQRRRERPVEAVICESIRNYSLPSPYSQAACSAPSFAYAGPAPCSCRRGH